MAQITHGPFSQTGFETAFLGGLHRLITDDPSPAEVVVVAGNGIFYEDRRLHLATGRQAAAFTLRAAKGDASIPADDANVLKLALDQNLIGNPMTMQERGEGDFKVLLHSLRQYKPQGETVLSVPTTELYKPFDPNRFNFNMVERQAFLRGELGHVKYTALFNKYPFVLGHALLIPDPKLNLPQYLTKEYHDFAWDFMASASEGTYIGYNSVLAGASVNHLHFHLVVGSGQLLPVQVTPQNSRLYPAHKTESESRRESWERIQSLNLDNRPYNTVWVAGKSIVFPRARPGTYERPSWNPNIAWSELAGNAVTSDSDTYRTISEMAIWKALNDTTVPDLAQVA